MRTNPNIKLISIPEELREIAYYTTPSMLKKYQDFHWPPIDLLNREKPPEVDSSVVGSLFARSLLAKVSLYNTNNPPGEYGRLFAKVDHPGVEIVPGCLSKKRIPRHLSPDELEARAKYQRQTLIFWNKAKLPSPRFVGFSEHEVLVKGKKIAEEQKAYALVMQRIDAPSHDRDLLAINRTIEDYQAGLEDRLLGADHQRSTVLNISELHEEKSRIVRSIMNTQIRCQLLGTYHLDDLAQEVDGAPYEIHSSEDYIREAQLCVSHYLRAFNLYQQLVAKPTPTISLQNAQNDHFPWKQWLTHQRTVRAFQKAFQPFFEELYSDERSFRYIHGDAYPHNYAGRFMREGVVEFLEQDLGMQSVMFSPNRAKRGLPEEDLSKLLISPILDLKPSDIDLFVKEYHAHQLATAKSMARGKKGRPGIESLITSFTSEELVDRVDCMLMKIAIEMLGLKGKDEIFNKKVYETIRTKLHPYDLSNSLVRFPESTIPESVPTKPNQVYFTPYATANTFEHVTHLVKARMDSFLTRERENNNPYTSLKQPMRTLRELFDKHLTFPKQD
tara:strand:+ start:15099 stop:16772 length:1674 start_codon:yes stop_codon:yes gene_type:complete